MTELRDLSNAEQNREVLATASTLLAEHRSDIAAYDRALAANGAAHEPVLLQAARCAHSRFALSEAVASLKSRSDHQPSSPTVRLSVVWAMYRETVRLGAAADGGQDLLRHKIEQMRWLTDGLDVVWQLFAVDDGCPESPSSAQVARELLASEPLLGDPERERVTVLELRDALPGGSATSHSAGLSPAFRALRSTDESRKGGSIVYGLWRAVNEQSDDRAVHILVYTDADLSANLAEAGLLAAPIAQGASEVVAGHRYGLPGAVLIDNQGARCEPASTGNKPDKMIVLFRHFVRGVLFPQLRPVADTQAGFKAFSASVLRQTLPQIEAFDETFDVELLIRSGVVDTAPITFVEDFDNSNFQTELVDDDAATFAEPGERHFAMITQLLEIHQRLQAQEIEAGVAGGEDELIAWLRSLDVAAYQRIIRKLQRDDAERRATGGGDPLFEVSWTLEELSGM